MFLRKKKVIVQLRKTLSGVIVSSYRIEGRRRTYDIKTIPYALAIYLRLMPENYNASPYFSRKLYDFSNEELDELSADGIAILKVTRKNGGVFVTIDLESV